MDRRHLASFIAAFTCLRLFEAALGQGPVLLPDSPMYLPVAGESRFGQVDFLGDAPRPWVITLLFALAPNNHWIVAAQVLASVLAWVALLAAVAGMPFASRTGRWLTLVCVAAVGLSAAATQWDSYVQSDSLAQSGTVLFLAGVLFVNRGNRPWWGVACLSLGSLVAAMVRPVLVLPMVGVAVWLGLSAFLSPGWPPRRRSSPRKWAAAGGLVLLLLSAYVSYANEQADRAWGRDFVANSDVNGRTLQQVGVINMTAWGHGVVMQLVSDGGHDCLAQEYGALAASDRWRATIVANCPQEAAAFSHEFQAEYSKWLLGNARAAQRVLTAPFNEAFAAPNPGNVVDLIPSSLTQTWSSVPPAINPVILWVLLLLGTGAGVAVLGGRFRFHTIPMMIVATTAVLAVVATVAISPLDAARVGSAPAMLARLSAIVGFVLAGDLAIRALRRRGGSQPPSVSLTSWLRTARSGSAEHDLRSEGVGAEERDDERASLGAHNVLAKNVHDRPDSAVGESQPNETGDAEQCRLHERP